VIRRRRSRRAGAPDAGFTLVEVLVASSVAAVVLMAVYAVMSQSLLIWDHAAAAVDTVRSLRCAYEHLADDLSSAVVVSGEALGAFTLEDHGDRDRLSFLASGIRPRQGEGNAAVLVRVSYGIASGGHGLRLVREAETLAGSRSIGLPVGRRCVAQDVSVFDVKALGSDGWEDAWDVSDELPPALRIRIQCADENRVVTVLLSGGVDL